VNRAPGNVVPRGVMRPRSNGCAKALTAKLFDAVLVLGSVLMTLSAVSFASSGAGQSDLLTTREAVMACLVLQ